MYTRIASLPDNVQCLTTPELDALSKVWLERMPVLEQDGAYQEFIRRLQREWAIETGIIERLYNWEHAVTKELIKQGIDSALIAERSRLQPEEAELVSSLIDDQHCVVKVLYSSAKEDEQLTEVFIRSMHAQFTLHQEYLEVMTDYGRQK